MNDPFYKLDHWNSKINFFREINYWRKVILVFVAFCGLGFWVVFGFDSGVGMLTRLLGNLPKLISFQWSLAEWWTDAYAIYGVTFHFSAFVIYGLLFYGLSWWFEKIGITKSKNLFLTINLTLLNVTVFEHWYMASYAIFQTNRYLWTWYFEDFGFMCFYFVIGIGGLYAIFYFLADSCILNGKEIVGRKYQFKPSPKLLLVFASLIIGILFWYYYPFPIQHVQMEGWISSANFPQTVYGMKHYPNNLLHSINVIDKALFALTQFFIIYQFKEVKSQCCQH